MFEKNGIKYDVFHCKRCDTDFTSKNLPTPKRCGKCKSPYWDRERRNEIVDVVKGAK